jgi:hypothetical protein
MSDIWNGAGSGDWDKKDYNGLEEGDGASWVQGTSEPHNARGQHHSSG